MLLSTLKSDLKLAFYLTGNTDGYVKTVGALGPLDGSVRSHDFGAVKCKMQEEGTISG